MPTSTLLTTASARGRLAVSVREHRPDVPDRRRDLTAATLRAAILRETGKGYPITRHHAAELSALLHQVAL